MKKISPDGAGLEGSKPKLNLHDNSRPRQPLQATAARYCRRRMSRAEQVDFLRVRVPKLRKYTRAIEDKPAILTAR
jgi:hypothetical protein